MLPEKTFYRSGMETLDQLARLGLFNAQVPRYTSYPTAPIFSQDVGSRFQRDALKALNPSVPVSVYIHIPFCERLCWFCACRTQGTSKLKPVETYLDSLKAELRMVSEVLPKGLTMGRMHWGGGTPTILPPDLIHNLADAIKEVIQPADAFEFSVEVDPTLVDEAKIKALAAEGMNRASMGIQDFSPEVQAAIGREQPYELTSECMQMLREAGITSLNTDLVYGLPHQTDYAITQTIEKVLTLDPDRVALFGYAHVPHMAKRQKLIDESALPGDIDRYRLAVRAAGLFQDAGYESIGIDHFAKPGDGLAEAARQHSLRRNFQGYTTDTCSTLIGFGASSISRFASGYVQNLAATAAYIQRIENGELAGFRGHVLSTEDGLHARAIEMLMCDFQINEWELAERFGALTKTLEPLNEKVLAKSSGLVVRSKTGIRILPEGRPLTRIIAQFYDQYSHEPALYSKAS